MAMVLHASENDATVLSLVGGRSAVTTARGYGLVALAVALLAVVIVAVHGPERLAPGPIPWGSSEGGA